MSETTFHPAAKLDEVPEGTIKPVEIGGTPIILCNTDGRIFAVINRCSHAEAKLECGRMKRGWISCPVHGARFDLETGDPLNPPATQPITTYEMRVVDGIIEVAV